MKLGQWMPGRCSHYHRTPSCSEETPNFQKQAKKHIARSSNYVELDGAWSCGCLGMENHGNILWKFCQICRANRRPHCLFCNCCNRLQVLLPVHSCRLAVRQHRWLSAGQTRKALAKNLRTLENFRVAKMQEEHWKLTKLCSINLMDTRSAHLALGYSSCMSDLEHTGRLRCLEHASRFHSECGNSTRCPCIPATGANLLAFLQWGCLHHNVVVRWIVWCVCSSACTINASIEDCEDRSRDIAQTTGALKAIGSVNPFQVCPQLTLCP